MLQYVERPEFELLPLTLSNVQMLDPYSVLEDLCSAFTLGQLRIIMSEMIEICLTVEDDLFRETKKRADTLYMARKIEQVLEAVFMIIAQRESDK